jgi:hypothetical protein
MTIALVGFLVLVLLLCVPLSVEFSLETGWQLQVRPRWGTFRMPTSSRRGSQDERARERPKTRPRGKRRASPSFRKLRVLIRSPDFLASLARLGRRLLGHLRPRELRLRLKLGLGDPADTGRAWGALAPLFLALSRLEAEEIRIEPDFLRRSFDLEARAVVRVVPGVLLLLLVGYLLTTAPWRALLRYARA